MGASSGPGSRPTDEVASASSPDGFDPSRMKLAYEELRGCIIRRPGDTCEVRKEFLDVALRSLREGIHWVLTSGGPDENAATEQFLHQLYADADEIEACGGGNEAANMRRAGNLIRSYWRALEVIADVWALPPVTNQQSRKWHCQHEEWLASAAEIAADALGVAVCEPVRGRAVYDPRSDASLADVTRP